MAIALVRDNSLIKDGADAIGWLCEWSSTTTSTTGTVYTLPYLDEEKYARETKDTEVEDDSGTTVYSSSKLKSKKFTLNFLQTDKATLDLFDEVEAKTYILWMQRGIVGAEKQEWVFYGKIGGKTDMSWKDVSKVGFEFIAQKNTATMTVTKLHTTLCWATQAVIPINKMHVIVTTAVT